MELLDVAILRAASVASINFHDGFSISPESDLLRRHWDRLRGDFLAAADDKAVSKEGAEFLWRRWLHPDLKRFRDELLASAKQDAKRQKKKQVGGCVRILGAVAGLFSPDSSTKANVQENHKRPISTIKSEIIRPSSTTTSSTAPSSSTQCLFDRYVTPARIRDFVLRSAVPEPLIPTCILDEVDEEKDIGRSAEQIVSTTTSLSEKADIYYESLSEETTEDIYESVLLEEAHSAFAIEARFTEDVRRAERSVIKVLGALEGGLALDPFGELQVVGCADPCEGARFAQQVLIRARESLLAVRRGFVYPRLSLIFQTLGMRAVQRRQERYLRCLHRAEMKDPLFATKEGTSSQLQLSSIYEYERALWPIVAEFLAPDSLLAFLPSEKIARRFLQTDSKFGEKWFTKAAQKMLQRSLDSGVSRSSTAQTSKLQKQLVNFALGELRRIRNHLIHSSEVSLKSTLTEMGEKNSKAKEESRSTETSTTSRPILGHQGQEQDKSVKIEVLGILREVLLRRILVPAAQNFGLVTGIFDPQSGDYALRHKFTDCPRLLLQEALGKSGYAVVKRRDGTSTTSTDHGASLLGEDGTETDEVENDPTLRAQLECCRELSGSLRRHMMWNLALRGDAHFETTVLGAYSPLPMEVVRKGKDAGAGYQEAGLKRRNNYNKREQELKMLEVFEDGILDSRVDTTWSELRSDWETRRRSLRRRRVANDLMINSHYSEDTRRSSSGSSIFNSEDDGTGDRRVQAPVVESLFTTLLARHNDTVRFAASSWNPLFDGGVLPKEANEDHDLLYPLLSAMVLALRVSLAKGQRSYAMDEADTDETLARKVELIANTLSAKKRAVGQTTGGKGSGGKGGPGKGHVISRGHRERSMEMFAGKGSEFSDHEQETTSSNKTLSIALLEASKVDQGKDQHGKKKNEGDLLKRLDGVFSYAGSSERNEVALKAAGQNSHLRYLHHSLPRWITILGYDVRPTPYVHVTHLHHVDGRVVEWKNSTHLVEQSGGNRGRRRFGANVMKHFIGKSVKTASDLEVRLATARLYDLQSSASGRKKTPNDQPPSIAPTSSSSLGTLRTGTVGDHGTYGIPPFIFSVNRLAESMRTARAIQGNTGIPFVQFNDRHCLDWIRNHPIAEFPQAESVFTTSLRVGAHKADFCLLWVLYTRGGLHLDSDVLLYPKFQELAPFVFGAHYDFVALTGASLEASGYDFIDTGFMASRPGTQLLYDGIAHIYRLRDRDELWSPVSSTTYWSTCWLLGSLMRKYYATTSASASPGGLLDDTSLAANYSSSTPVDQVQTNGGRALRIMPAHMEFFSF
ncbi:unnamed protein product [Amoebophrya sp. A25]|nr:unnamed protein product [Amoebophrya sp. A25]|eukprot:GSA25T00023436001.1